MALKKTDVVSFLEMAKSIPVIDVRSPSEFNSGHIPGAVNIPLFDDEERAIVGTKYRNEGRVPAILEGLKKAGPAMTSKLEMALNNSRHSRLLVHCWRGGMRSEAMAWLFSLGDIQTEILEGGYKSYRNYILGRLSEKRRMIVLGGMTGSGKTHILQKLSDRGHQVIDLERLANHKGSAFGSLGQPPQPSTEYFANILYDRWKDLDVAQPFLIEDESRNIGSVFMPDEFYLNMQKSPAIILLMDVKTRLPRLMEEYSVFPPDELKDSIMKISKRLGGDNTRNALAAVDEGDIEKAIEITLNYYDKTYMYGLGKKEQKNLIIIKSATDNLEYNAKLVADAAKNIKWKLQE
jgi:tRNA 2-selenouridine synthase